MAEVTLSSVSTPAGSISSAELLDLYEGNALYGLSPVKSEQASPLAKALEAGVRIEKGRLAVDGILLDAIKKIEATKHILPSRSRLASNRRFRVDHKA